MNEDLLQTVTRLEVIDKTGRAYVHYLDEGESIKTSMQDDNRTLKIFVDESHWPTELDA